MDPRTRGAESGEVELTHKTLQQLQVQKDSGILEQSMGVLGTELE